ncbi:Holliday junction resolvase RuvX [Polynucleobacter paneuropaeus]|uniref:Putative pre-16S rRNA nuclease n=1 Tax=Polynucleobacter paneuropaeus TaxID=2527775 RepID=A0ABX9FCF8_9BURK|nr:Holliday junction resolvase RuvX [Polynucleobacter paneuropaeus]AWW47397.1 Holliday junction resolvase RuvX [Polynucleobacter paneuropaeus]MBT8515209.1 Holliday junction resolvase RuvX [Polynucleobacter paneuropaeus]MBT8525889.1 Holliday junction resolvase RuvX [Polynucleobacter paneuropaeus]MBT8542088.1 Holliday junction resolvase RuvX [Polynucleobacter paneuropaeus]MBT8552383.1 Holliday junction resolvase RuvX [Polynucleobacter paneuropaeus]
MPSPLTVMGFDYGTRRIGIAIGNTLSCTAQALEVIARDNEDARFADIESLLKEWMPNLLVVGVPTHSDGAEHEMTAKAKRFGNQLSGRFKLPVEWVDERYSSVVLEGDPEMRDNLDAHSATLLLEQYFAERSLTGN